MSGTCWHCLHVQVINCNSLPLEHRPKFLLLHQMRNLLLMGRFYLKNLWNAPLTSLKALQQALARKRKVRTRRWKKRQSLGWKWRTTASCPSVMMKMRTSDTLSFNKQLTQIWNISWNAQTSRRENLAYGLLFFKDRMLKFWILTSFRKFICEPKHVCYSDFSQQNLHLCIQQSLNNWRFFLNI